MQFVCFLLHSLSCRESSRNSFFSLSFNTYCLDLTRINATMSYLTVKDTWIFWSPFSYCGLISIKYYRSPILSTRPTNSLHCPLKLLPKNTLYLQPMSGIYLLFPSREVPLQPWLSFEDIASPSTLSWWLFLPLSLFQCLPWHFQNILFLISCIPGFESQASDLITHCVPSAVYCSSSWFPRLSLQRSSLEWSCLLPYLLPTYCSESHLLTSSLLCLVS